MNVQELHSEDKAVNALTLFEGKEGVTKSLRYRRSEL